MERTYQYLSFETGVNVVNEAFLPGVFAMEQFRLDMLATNLDPSVRTSDLYPANPVSQVSTYFFGDIGSLVDQALALNCSAAYTFIEAVVQEYFKTLLSALLDLGCFTRHDGDDVVECVAQLLRRSASSVFGYWPAATFRYLRLRRNAIVHRAGKPSRGLADLARRGDKFEQYWREKRAIINGFRFDDKQLNQLTWYEVLDVLRIVRYGVQDADKAVIKAFGSETLIDATLTMRCKEVVVQTRNRSVNSKQKALVRWVGDRLRLSEGEKIYALTQIEAIVEKTLAWAQSDEIIG